MNITARMRRGACALLLLLVAHGGSWGSAEISKVPPPGVYRFKVGKLDVTALSDGTHPFPVSTVMVGANGALIDGALEHEFLGNPPMGSINAFLINTGRKLILVDAGAGLLYGDCCGQVVQQIKAAGYAPDQVDMVLLTHLHKDHVGGISDDGKRVFPNAVVRMSRADMDYWTSTVKKSEAADFLSTFFDAATLSLAPYRSAGKLVPIDEGPVDEGIEAIPSPGHTPGHLSYAFTSEGDTLLVVGDLVHVAALQLKHPEITVKYDTDGKLARASRSRILEMAASRRYLIAAAHITFPGLGHVRQMGGSFEWVPLNFEAAPRR